MNHISSDIIIIGGGAAGLMAAAGAADLCSAKGIDAKVLVLEKMARPGRKIMITGKADVTLLILRTGTSSRSIFILSLDSLSRLSITSLRRR